MGLITPAASCSLIPVCSNALVFCPTLYGAYLNFLVPIMIPMACEVTFIFLSLLEHMDSFFFNILRITR